MNQSFSWLSSFLKRVLSRKDTSSEFPAILGKTDGTVLTGTPGIVYATKWNGDVIQVVNRRVPNKPYRHVIIGYDRSQPGVLQVLYTRDVFGSADPDEPEIPDHDHSYPGHNTTWVKADQFMPLLVRPYSGMTVIIHGAPFRKLDGTAGVVRNQTLNLSSYQPASGAKYVSIEHDDDGVVTVVEGSPVAAKELLTTSDIPAVTNFFIIAIRLYSEQTTVQRNPRSEFNDFIDPRFAGVPKHEHIGTDWDGNIEDIDENSSTDIGEDLADDDQFIVFNTSESKWVRSTISRIQSYLPTHYRQLIWAADGSGGFEFVTDNEGMPVTALHPLE